MAMTEQRADPVAAAAMRLEAAVTALAAALTRRPSMAEADGELVPRAAVAAMAERLDATLVRLRHVLADELRAEES
jgi:hypothetical protein